MIRSSATVLLGALLISACSTVNIDQMRLQDTRIDRDTERVVVLGRQDTAAFEAEESLVDCVAGELGGGRASIDVIAQEEFVNSLYPWFEPRTAPLNITRFTALLENGQLKQAIENYRIRYIIWIDGFTETTDSSGGMSCTLTAAGGGCLGMGIWQDEGTYEATIWDFLELRESGRISADASGTSYMPAIIIPIPLLAMVQTDTCHGLGRQLQAFLVSE